MAAKTHAIILAGGRSSRLHASAPHRVADKPLLRKDGVSLLALTVEVAQQFTDHVVVVGDPVQLRSEVDDVAIVREDPPYSGPAKAIATGLEHLTTMAEPSESDWVFILGADMPRISDGIVALRDAFATDAEPDALIGEDNGRMQPLISAVKMGTGRDAFSQTQDGDSVMRFLKQLNPGTVALPPGTSTDVDTWPDAEQAGFTESK